MAPVKTPDKNNDKRQAILDASLRLFCATCFQDTSTASISQEAKVATGTLFLYFESKEELVNELYLECKGEFASYMEEGVWDKPSFKLQLKHIWERSCEWCLKNPDKLQFMTQFSSSPYITKATREKAVSRFGLMTEVVQKAVDNKEVTTSSVEMLSSLLGGYFHSARMYLVDHPHSKNIKIWKEEMFDCIWSGIN